MLSLPLTGLALAGSTLLSKYYRYSSKNKGKTQFKRNTHKKRMKIKPSRAVNPFRPLYKGLKSALSQIAKITAREDYSTVIKDFLPSGAALLKPRYPLNSKEIQLADLDGDSVKELVASFKHNNEIKTVILKKEKERWHKAAEISNPGYNAIHFRDTISITGEGKRQLLLGLTSNEKLPTLYGYDFSNNGADKILDRTYKRFELLRAPQRKSIPARAQLAVWNKNDTGGYDIDVLHWKDSQLQPQKNISTYYANSVVPYYARKIRQSPYDPSLWYNFAEALSKTGLRRDTLIAINVGMSQAQDASLKEKFLELRSKIV
ncbi:MAG: hypothetical protein QHH06_08730 [Clostridiales bacterium]|jgi:hypothetical protein|nr:hypothetical protein [Eubacteriales bacterium]MDH7566549.1 hypothetical protein [Clostridiales bacterium]